MGATLLPLCRRSNSRVTFAVEDASPLRGAAAAAGDLSATAASCCFSTSGGGLTSASLLRLAVGTPAASPSALSTRSGGSTPGGRQDFWQRLAGIESAAAEPEARPKPQPQHEGQAPSTAALYCGYLYRRAARPHWAAFRAPTMRCKV